MAAQALGEVAVVGELGVVEAAVEHALVAARDQRGGRRVGVGDVEERRQQPAAGVAHREVALVALHGGDQDLVAAAAGGARRSRRARTLGHSAR